MQFKTGISASRGNNKNIVNPFGLRISIKRSNICSTSQKNINTFSATVKYMICINITKMKVFVFAAFYLALTTALPSYPLVQDSEGEEYYLIPITRHRRDVIDWRIDDPANVKIQHQKTFTIDDNNKVDVTSYARKNLLDKQIPLTTGGKFDYSNNNGHGAVLQVENTRTRGTDLGLDAKYNVYKNKDMSVDVTGGYSRHYGGPQGTQHPSKNVFLSGSWRI